MAAKIILHEKINENDFSFYTQIWGKNSSVLLYIDPMAEESKLAIFNMAISRIPDSFSEAVVDLFLEDENFPIDERELIKCIRYGSFGLKRSVFYRKSTPQYIRDLCSSNIKNNDPEYNK